MNCKECNSDKVEYDERLGEKICVECGFVIVHGMFEETVSNFNNDGTLKPNTIGSV